MQPRAITAHVRTGATWALASMLAVGLSLSGAVRARAADDVQDAN